MTWKIVLVSAALAIFGPVSAQNDTQNGDPRVVCYFSSWAIYRPGTGRFTVADIDATLCTHVIYAFAGVSKDGNLEFLDEFNDIGNQWSDGQIQGLPKLKAQNPDVKVLLAIGGFNHGPQNFQTVARDPAKRKIFVESAFSILNKYQLDGIDIDWEYQDSVGGTEADKVGLSAWLAEIKAKFAPAGLLVTIATPANLNLVKNCYELDKVSESVDFINIMAYDFHGAWEPVTGHVTPLYAGSGNPDLSVEAVLSYYIENGAVPEKINLGLITYGRSFTLADESKYFVGAPAIGPGNIDNMIPEAGVVAYGDICLKTWPEQWDDTQGVPYMSQGDQWISYDNPDSYADKIEFASNYGVKNVFVWSVETDDKSGDCTGESFPLIRAATTYLKALS